MLFRCSFQPGSVVLGSENWQSNSPFSSEFLFFQMSGCFQTGFKLCERFSRRLLISTVNHHDLDFTLLSYFCSTFESSFRSSLEPLFILGKMHANYVDVEEVCQIRQL